MFFDRIYYIFFFFFFFSSQNFKRGGALAPPMDAPPLVGVKRPGGNSDLLMDTLTNEDSGDRPTTLRFQDDHSPHWATATPAHSICFLGNTGWDVTLYSHAKGLERVISQISNGFLREHCATFLTFYILQYKPVNQAIDIARINLWPLYKNVLV